MKRNIISLLIAMLIIIMAVTGVLAFFLPFNLLIVSVHALLGFLFIAAITFHIKNNFKPLTNYLKSKTAILILLSVVGLSVFILFQPAPVKWILGLSKNMGPAVDRFELSDEVMTYNYSPAEHYKIQLDFRKGKACKTEDPPYVAIWLENQSSYHIKTLFTTEKVGYEKMLPYWHYKKAEYEKAKKEAEEKKAESDDEKKVAAVEGQAEDEEALEELDGLSGATPNDSFDPADYIIPKDPEKEKPFRLLIEINLPNDKNEFHEDQPSLVYSVEVDNKDPKVYQVVELVGFPKLEESEEEEGKLAWNLYYIDESITTALDLFDSALLTIERK